MSVYLGHVNACDMLMSLVITFTAISLIMYTHLLICLCVFYLDVYSNACNAKMRLSFVNSLTFLLAVRSGEFKSGGNLPDMLKYSILGDLNPD